MCSCEGIYLHAVHAHVHMFECAHMCQCVPVSVGMSLHTHKCEQHWVSSSIIPPYF